MVKQQLDIVYICTQDMNNIMIHQKNHINNSMWINNVRSAVTYDFVYSYC